MSVSDMFIIKGIAVIIITKLKQTMHEVYYNKSILLQSTCNPERIDKRCGEKGHDVFIMVFRLHGHHTV